MAVLRRLHGLFAGRPRMAMVAQSIALAAFVASNLHPTFEVPRPTSRPAAAGDAPLPMHHRG